MVAIRRGNGWVGKVIVAENEKAAAASPEDQGEAEAEGADHNPPEKKSGEGRGEVPTTRKVQQV